MMDNIKTPEEWSIALYGEIYLSASNGIGGTQNKDGVGIPVSRIETIAEQRIDYTRVGYLSSFDDEKVQKHELQQDDILFSHINSPIHLGKTAIYDGVGKLYHGINLLRIVVDKSVFSPKLFNYHCKYTRALGFFSLNAQHAVNQSSLNQKKLSAFKIPLPPLAEQNEIADRLDILLAQVEATQARLVRIPDIIKRFRQSVLAAAVSGKLTEDWRAQINKTEWQMTSLGDLLIDATNGLAKRHGSSGLDTTVLRLADFKDCTRVTGNERTICLTEKEINKYSLQENDILVIRVNGSIDLAGKFILYSNNDAIEGFCDHLIRLRIDLNKLSAKYLTYVANEGDGRWYLQNNLSTSAGQNTINQSTIKGLKIPLPSINEQTEIVRRVEQLFAYADTLEQQTKTAKARVDNLTQAILAKAFRGELTADWRAANPDLISGDNSATTLLTRIQDERGSRKKNREKR